MVIDLAEFNKRLNDLHAQDMRKLLPSHLFHITQKSRVGSILVSGLKLDQERASEGGTIFGIYLTDDPEYVFQVGDFAKKNSAVLKVDLRAVRDQLFIDPEWVQDDEVSVASYVEDWKNKAQIFSGYCTANIPSKFVKLVSLG